MPPAALARSIRARTAALGDAELASIVRRMSCDGTMSESPSLHSSSAPSGANGTSRMSIQLASSGS